MSGYRTVSHRVLLVLAVVAIGCFAIAQNAKVVIRSDTYREKLRASRLTQLSMQAIRDERFPKRSEIDLVNDPHATGMIGQEYTLITTDRGVIRSKLTSTNPNFGAVMVELLTKAGLNAGDAIAASLTGSFPGLNIAFYAACDVLELKPLAITSAGSSTWGANDPMFTWLDMEDLLHQKGLIRTKSIAASIGGGEDKGRGLSRLGRRYIEESIERNGIPMIREATLEESISKRMEILYDHAGDQSIKAVINIGGGVASLGASINGKLIPSGLSMSLARRNFPVKGTTLLLAERGIPVIHVLRVQTLAKRYGLPAPPGPHPEIGVGPIYFTERLNGAVAGLLLFVLGLLLLITIRVDLAHSLLRKTSTEPTIRGGEM